MKTCTGCKQNKPLSSFQFVNRKTRKPDYYSKCKPCWAKQAHKIYLTPKGRATSCWNAILDRAENAWGKTPTYANVKVKLSRQEFINFFIPAVKKFMRKFPNTVPTIDRIDNDGHYELGNLQILSKRDNTLKRPSNKRLHSPKGYSWCHICKTYKTVDNFHIARALSNGYCGSCKLCAKLKRIYSSSNKSKS